MFKIEKNIPLGGDESSRKSYPFKDMSCGESFFSPVTGKDEQRLRLAASAYGRYHDIVFVVRKRIENGATGVRVWMLGTKQPDDGRDSVDGMGDNPDQEDT